MSPGTPPSDRKPRQPSAAVSPCSTVNRPAERQEVEQGSPSSIVSSERDAVSSPQPGARPNLNQDYDLSTPIDPNGVGLRQNLPSYGDAHFSLFMRKLFIKAMGYSEDALSRPIVGIVNTYSSFNPCHANIPQLIEAVKRGVQLSGGLAIDFPTISLHESFAAPTSMFLRNLMSMDTEEMIRAQPVDSVVLIGGCDKTTPAQLMGGISANKPIIHLVTGPMMPGSFRGMRVGACTDCRSNWARFRAGKLDIEDISALNEELAPTAGTCGVMGTASTMACLLAALGMMPVQGATAPAVSSARLRIAESTGTHAVQLAEKRLQPQTILTRESFLNAITVLQAIGGSTNAMVHLMAIINRHPALCGTITPATIDSIGRHTPLLVDLKPRGENYMTDFHAAGGMVALLHELKPLLHLDALTVTGRTLGEELARIPHHHRRRPLPPPDSPASPSCIRPLADPIHPSPALVVFQQGNLSPGGAAVIKASASRNRRLLQHRGRAVVFDGAADLAARIDDLGLDVDADSVLVLRGIGPVGNPGMPEAGLIPIPRKLGARGVVDMLRISDGRMSGTAGGTMVLHVSPEGADPASVLGVVRDGDVVVCDADQRLLSVELRPEEIQARMEQRRRGFTPTTPWVAREDARGYHGLYLREVNQAEHGADFRFLTAGGPRARQKEAEPAA